MVQVGSVTYFQDHRWYDELADGRLKDETLALKAKVEGSWGRRDSQGDEILWMVNAYVIALFTRMENFGQGPYANMKTKWTRHEEHPNPEPSSCKIRRFEMMKYSFNDNEEYITIKESKYLNHSKDSLDAYRELLHLIDEGWVVTTPEDE
ncbi:hypothetical protein Tco_0609194 [Tanacetum coccineum]